MTNNTYSGNRHNFVDIEHISTNFMEIFQVGGFPNFEYQFLQVILCASFVTVTLTNKC